MGLRLRDLLGTILLVAIGVPYVGYLVNGEMPFIQDPRGMAATGLILGTAMFLVMRWGDHRDRARWSEIGFAAAVGALGVVALLLAETAAAEILLAAFMVGVLAVFVVELLDHAGVLGRHDTMTPAASR